MKAFFTSSFILMALMWASCKKTGLVAVSNTQLIGRWNLVSDSTWSSGIGPYGTPSSFKYIGVEGDNFTFTQNKLYIKEGNIKLDTATYTVVGDTLKLVYDYLDNGGVRVIGSIGSYIIVPINQHNLQLKNLFITPGGLINEYIMLNR